MVTASTQVSLDDFVGTTDLPQFRALATVCTYSLRLMVTRILMVSLPLSRRIQVGQISMVVHQKKLTTPSANTTIFKTTAILLVRTLGDIMHFLLQILTSYLNHGPTELLMLNLISVSMVMN